MTQSRYLNREPWIQIPSKQELEAWGLKERIAYNQHSRQAAKMDFYRFAFDCLSCNQIVGDYHEYGCHRVRTFRMALTEAFRQGLTDMKFFAFDSFQGLPNVEEESDMDVWTEGALCTSEEEFRSIIEQHGILVENIKTIKGFYDQTLTSELQQEFAAKEQKIAFACIDCDLYESAVPVFSFIEPLLQEGSLIYIDDMFAGYRGSPQKGVSLAFRDYQKDSRFQFVPHMQVGWWGQCFIAYI